MPRITAMILTALCCVSAGVTGSLCAFSTHYNFPAFFSDNFNYVVRLGTYGGLVGAVISIACLSLINRKDFVVVSVLSFLITWLTMFVLWFILSSAVDLD